MIGFVLYLSLVYDICYFINNAPYPVGFDMLMFSMICLLVCSCACLYWTTNYNEEPFQFFLFFIFYLLSSSIILRGFRLSMIYPDSVTTSCGAHFVTILFLSNYRTAVTIEVQYQLVKGIEEALYSYRVRDGLRKEVSVLLCKVIELPEVYIGANRWHSIPNKRFLL